MFSRYLKGGGEVREGVLRFCFDFGFEQLNPTPAAPTPPPLERLVEYRVHQKVTVSLREN